MISEEVKQPVTLHKKHADLTKPSFGNYNRNEWALLGAPCALIKLFSEQIIKALSAKYKGAYADTAHNDDIVPLPGRLNSGAVIEYTNQLNYDQVNYNSRFDHFRLRDIFSQADFVLVNGNHQQAKAQVVILSENKKASLQKRVDQLSNVALFLLNDDTSEIFDYIKDAVPGWQQIPVYRISDTEKIVSFFEEKLQRAKPVLNGLVLAGGRSERMGFDKGKVNWYGKEQRYHMADLLQPFCNDVYISCRADQQNEIDKQYLTLPDTFTGLGPFGAILSAFREKPDNAWLIIACDMPLSDQQTLKYLIENRNPASVATAYQSPDNSFPEPLITIWEPRSYTVLLSFLAQGYSCPRKVLINSDVHLLTAPDIAGLTNVNTPDELDKIKRILHQKSAAE